MPQYQCIGKLPHKRHTQFRGPTGALFNEELVSAQGFSDAYSLLYHVSTPTAVRAIMEGDPMPVREWANEVHRHHLFDTNKFAGVGGDVLESRRPLLFNDDIIISVAFPDRVGQAMYRNALRDELVYVGEGEGSLFTPWGRLRYESGDMIVIPRGTTQDWHPLTGLSHRFLILESASAITPPARYLTSSGQFSEHSPVCERDIKVPELVEPRLDRGDFPVRVKFGETINIHHLASHPFDVVGWDGCLYPYAISARDFEPVTRRIHTMPDEQQIFETVGAAICCFVNRVADYHPLSIPAPPIHSSVDVDEVLFNMGTTIFGWKGPYPGMMTFHPRGFPHGPKPGVPEATIGMKELDLNAIMVDAARPLRRTHWAQDCDDPGYPTLWLSENEAAE